MRLIRRLFVIFCLVATGATVWGLVYVRKEGFTRSWRGAIEGEFTKRGYHVEIGKITLGAFRGLVAENVRFFQGPERREETAFIDDVFLDVDLSDILKSVFQSKELSINTLDVQDAMLSLLVNPGDPNSKERLRINHLSGRIEVTESIIQIVRAEAEVSGVVVSIKGSLLRPPGNTEPKKEGKDDKALARLSKTRMQLQRVFQEIAQYEFPDERPTLNIEFRGDLRDIATTTATVRLDVSRFHKKDQPYEVSSLNAEIEFDGRNDKLEITEFFLRDGKGELRVEANWEKDADKVNFKVDSSVDIVQLAGLYLSDQRFGEIVFYQAPQVTAEGFVSMEQLEELLKDKPESEDVRAFRFPGEVLGEVHFEKFVSKGTVFNGLDCGYSLAEDRFYLRNLRLDHKTGVAFLNVKCEPGRGDETVQYQTEIKLDPRVFRPFFNENGRRFLDLWDFDENSTVYFAAVGQGAGIDYKKWKNKGVIDLRNFKLKGVTFQQMETDFETDNELQYFRNVKMTRHDGSIDAELAQHNLLTKQWEVKGVLFTTDLIEGTRAFSPNLSKSLGRYQMDSPPTIRLSGTLDGRRAEEVGSSPRNTDIQVEFVCNGDVRTDFLGKTLRLSSPSGKVKVEKSRVHLTSMDAGVFGGRVSLEYDGKNVRSSVKPYDATIRLKGVSLNSVIRQFGGSSSATGTLDSALNLSGNSRTVGSLNGHGTVGISDGDLFKIPAFGPLSKLITDASPKQDRAGFSIARKGSATFQIKNGVIFTKDLEAQTQAFKLKAAGSIDCNDKALDIEAIAYYRDSLRGVILAPVSELLTYSGTGSLSKPVWKPKHISSMVKLPAQLVIGVGEIPVKGLQMIWRTLLGPNQKKEEQEKPESGTENKKPVSTKPLQQLDNFLKKIKTDEKE